MAADFNGGVSVRIDKDLLAARAGGAMPWPVVRRWLGKSLEGHHAALCLHRVAAQRRASDWQPGLTIAPGELDALLETLLAARPGPGERWLTAAFDDGYQDSLEYVASRARRFPTVDFVFFVCPEKLEARAGFRWDLVEEALRRGTPPGEARALETAPADIATENARDDLGALADAPAYRLAEVDAVKALTAEPNVALGNHTNCHLKATQVPLADVELEYRRSTESFERLFGPQRLFAFPFGTPVHQFDERHVRLLRALGDFTIWSTEPRPFLPSERVPGAVLPRFPVDGQRPHKELAAWIAARATDFRLRGPRQWY